MIRAFGRVPWTAELLKGLTVAGRSRLAFPSLFSLYHLVCSAYDQTGFFPYYCSWGASCHADRLGVFCFNKVEDLGLSTRSGRHLGPKMGWVRRRKETGACPCSDAEVLNCPIKLPFYHVGLTVLSVSIFSLHHQSAYQNLGRGHFMSCLFFCRGCSTWLSKYRHFVSPHFIPGVLVLFC